VVETETETEVLPVTETTATDTEPAVTVITTDTEPPATTAATTIAGTDTETTVPATSTTAATDPEPTPFRIYVLPEGGGTGPDDRIYFRQQNYLGIYQLLYLEVEPDTDPNPIAEFVLDGSQHLSLVMEPDMYAVDLAPTGPLFFTDAEIITLNEYPYFSFEINAETSELSVTPTADTINLQVCTGPEDYPGLLQVVIGPVVTTGCTAQTLFVELAV